MKIQLPANQIQQSRSQHKLQQPQSRPPPKLQQQLEIVTETAVQGAHVEGPALFGGCALDHVHHHAVMEDAVTQTQHPLHHLLNAVHVLHAFHGHHVSHADV